MMKLFATYDEIWAALLARGEENGDTWRFESHFIDCLVSKFGESPDNWEVLQISSGVAAFLINIEVSLVDSTLITALRTCLSSTIPELCVFLHVFDGPINSAYSTAQAAIAISKSDLWVWRGQSLIVAAVTDPGPFSTLS